jgi:hypothetical protein
MELDIQDGLRAAIAPLAPSVPDLHSNAPLVAPNRLRAAL